MLIRLSWLFVILIALPTIFPLIRAGFFSMQDDMQAFRLQQMDKCFGDRQIPCRWIPDGGYQYGYPQFNYYAPGVYYLGEAVHLIGFQFIDTVKVLFILGAILSALASFLLFKSLWGAWPALVGSALYTYAPIKAMEIYVRGALSEFWSFVFFPLIFWSTYQLVKTTRLKYFAWLAVFWGMLFLTHNLMSFLFLPVFFVWLGYWLWQEKKWRMGLNSLLALILGFGLAAFFVLPMLFERQFVHVESMLGGYFDYRQHFVTLQQLLFSNHFGYGSSVLGPNDDLSLSTGIPQWIGALLAIPLALVLRKKYTKLFYLALVLVSLNLIIWFLMHQKSSFLWERLSFLAWLQFPWRLLAYNTFLLSLLGALAVFLSGKLKTNKLAILLGLIMITGVIIVQGSFFQPKDWFNISDQDKFTGPSWEKQLTASIFDYLPIYAVLPPNYPALEVPEIKDGEAEIVNYRKASNYQTGQINVIQKSTVRLPIFDFPGMKVYVDGREVPHFHNDCRFEDYCFGLINFDLDSGYHKIEVRLTDTWIRRAGNIISLISFSLIILLLIRSSKNYEKLPV